MLGVLKEPEINELLTEQKIGRIGCHADGLTYVVPVTYIFENNYIIGHTRYGQKVKMLRLNPSVCFEVDSIESMTNWKSVILQGQYEELKGDAAYAAFHKFFEKIKRLLPSTTTHPHDSVNKIRITDISHSIIFRIKIMDKSGRFERIENKPLS